VNYSLLFLIVFIVSLVSLGFLMLVKERAADYEIKIEENPRQISKMLGILKNDKTNTYFFISIILLMAFGRMPFIFQTVYGCQGDGVIDMMSPCHRVTSECRRR
jgi:hypothetical protein